MKINNVYLRPICPFSDKPVLLFLRLSYMRIALLNVRGVFEILLQI